MESLTGGSVPRLLQPPPRRREPEVMDRPDLDPELHRQALRGLARVNLLSRADAAVWNGIRCRLRGDRLRVLDLACGGGDVTVRLWRRARRAGVALELEGWDLSDVAVEVAERRAHRATGGACPAPIRFRTVDVLEERLPGDFDVVMTSLFAHHLDPGAVVELLRRMAEAARELVLVEDLRRCRWGSLLATLVPRLLSRSPVVHVDARLSARAAYTPAEIRRLADRVGLTDLAVARHWPARWMLTAAGRESVAR